MNAILTNNPTLRIPSTQYSSAVLEWKRIKNKIRLMVKIDGVYDIGISNSDIEKYGKVCDDWQKQNENLIVKTPMPKDLVEKEIKIYSFVDPRDQFDMVFGMRSGYHLLIDPVMVNHGSVPKNWYSVVTFMYKDVIDQKGDVMSPVPGTIQGDFIPNLKYY